MRQLIFSPLAILQNPAYFIYDKPTDSWRLDEIKTNRLYCDSGNCGSTGTRIVPWGPWAEHPYGLSSQFQPYAMNADRTKFDLGHFNGWYFPFVRKFIKIAKSYGQPTWFALLDNCQFAGDFDRWSPWTNNVQGVSTFYDPRAWPFVKAWFEKCLAEFKGLDVRWPWGNETQKAAMVNLAKVAILPVIKARALDPEKMAYGATMEPVDYKPQPAGWKPTPEQPRWEPYPGNAGTLDALKKMVGDDPTFGDRVKLAIWKEIHSIGGKGYPAIPNRFDQARVWWMREVDNGIRLWLSNDGVFDGDSNCDIEGSKRRPSAVRMAEIVKATMIYKNDFTYEHLPKTESWPCIAATLRAMYREMAGQEPAVKYHYTSPIVPPEYVNVKVCSVSRWLPNAFCPTKVEMKFIKGQEPTNVCVLHGPPDPPQPPEPPAPPVQKCNCSGWFWKGDFKRWWNCLFRGGEKRCK